MNRVDAYELNDVRNTMEQEARERRLKEIRTMVEGFGDDTHEVGTALRVTTTDDCGDGVPYVFLKHSEDSWRRTGTSSSISWKQLVDWALTRRTPLKRSDFMDLAPVAAAEADNSAA